jgi:hypothetical protein
MPLQPSQRYPAGLPARRVDRVAVELYREQLAAAEIQEGGRAGAGELDRAARAERRRGRIGQVQLDQDVADLDLVRPPLSLGTPQAQDASTR